MAAGHRSINCPQYDELVPKKKTKSPIWTHFGLPADSSGQLVNENIAICKICTTAVSAKGGTTSNLISHLKLYHPSHYKDMFSVSKQTQPVFVPVPVPATVSYETNVDNPTPVLNSKSLNELESSVRKKQKTMLDFQPLNSGTANNITLSITKFLAATMQPYNLVEHQTFIDMCKTLNPRYTVPSRKYFSKQGIPKLYNETVDKVKYNLALVKTSEVSATTDCWTSVAGTPYMAVTCHFIDKDWELQSYCLNCTHFEKDHDANNIADELTNIFSEWGLNVQKLTSITTDNGSNILKAVDILKIPHISCFGHNINIGIKRVLQLPQLKRAVARLKSLQNTIAHSWKMQRDLKLAQEFLQEDAVKLPSACETRWWSTFKLCERFLANQLALCKMLQQYPSKKHLMCEGPEVASLENFISATKFLKEITTTLSGDQYTTSSSVLPLYRKIKKHLQSKEEDSQLTKEIKDVILATLKEKYEVEPLQSILRMCSFCDPRFRCNFTDYPNEMKEIAKNELIDYYQQSEDFTDNQTETTANPTDTTKKGLSKLFEDEEDALDDPELTPNKKAEVELNNYLTMPKVNMDTNPLTWWKSHEGSFPKLKHLARKYLAIQGTSVPSERVFSCGGNVITKHRASLLPKNAEMQVFLAQNKNI